MDVRKAVNRAVAFIRTGFSHKHLLRGAGGTLAHGVEHTDPDLVALVFTQVCQTGKRHRVKGPRLPLDTR